MCFWITFLTFDSYIYLITIFIFNTLNKVFSFSSGSPTIHSRANQLCHLKFLTVLPLTKRVSTYTSYICLSSLPSYKPSEYGPRIEIYFLLSSFTFPRYHCKTFYSFFATYCIYFFYLSPNFLFS